MDVLLQDTRSAVDINSLIFIREVGNAMKLSIYQGYQFIYKQFD